VYREADPRYSALMSRVREAYADDDRLGLVLEVPELAIERGGAVPNVDLALGSLTYLAEASPDAGEAVFAIGRTAGWIAHGIEEYSEAPLRFRARARYTGLRAAV
jgi:citrate synthase